MDNFDINVLENDGQVFVQDNEFSIIGDTFYSSSNYQEAPEWLLVLIDNVLTSKIAAGFTDYDLLVQDVRNAISSIDIANNTYVQQSNFTELVDGIVGSRLETLNATYEGSFATKAELDSVAAGADYALAQSISDLSATVDGQINAAVTNISTTMANNQQALASDITTISTVLDGNSAEISQTLQSINGIEASWSIDTDVNGQVAGIKLINSADAPSKFVINTDVFEVRNASTGDLVIGTDTQGVVVDATNLNGVPASEVINNLDTLVQDFNTQNNRDASAINSPVLASGAITHQTRDNGTVDLTITWDWTGDEASIDGFAINMYATSSSGTYTWGSQLSLETIFQLQAGKRSNTFSGLPSNLYYSFQVLAFRKVDSDINPNGIITSSWTSPVIAENPYQPETTMSITADVAGTVGGTSVDTLLADLQGVGDLVTDFNSQNNRNNSTIVNPTILTNGTAIDHTINSDGSADISFEWGWSGDEGAIDGFAVFHFQSNSNATHTFGSTPSAEIVYQMPASARSFILRGVAANQYHTFGVMVYRKVDPDISPNGIIATGIIVPSLSSENPYRPSSSVSFSGNIVGTIDGYSASSVRSNAYAGATFTSSNAGNLAYQNLVTTTYIDNLAVNRLKIADESAGILKYAIASSPVYGNNNWVQVLSLAITTPEAANCFVSITLQQGYNLNGTSPKNTGFRVKLNGSIIQQRTMGAINDTPSMTTGQYLSSGTNTFTVEWLGASSDVVLFSRSITSYVSLR